MKRLGQWLFTWLMLPLVMIAITPRYSPRRMKRYCKRQGISHAGYLRGSRFGYKGHCVCGYKTARFATRGTALMMVDFHVDDMAERIEAMRVYNVTDVAQTEQLASYLQEH